METSEASADALGSLLSRKNLPRGTRRIVRAMAARGPMLPSMLADQTGLARSTISTVVTGLRDAGIVVEETDAASAPKGVGRPSTSLALNPAAGTCVGVLLGYDMVAIMVANVAHKIIDQAEESIAPGYSIQQAAKLAKRLIDASYEKLDLPRQRLLGVGVAVAGPVTRDGTIKHSSILPKMAGSNARSEFHRVLGVPIFATNESNCSAIAEMTWGAMVDEPSFVLFKFDLGVGGAIVQNGDLIVGAAGGGGEFGHVGINPNGPLCRCGNRGCLEAFAGLQQPLETLSKAEGRRMPVEWIIDQANAGDGRAQQVLRDAAKAAGHGLAVVATILNPPVFLITGSLALAEETIMEPLLEAYEDNALIKPGSSRAEEETRIVVAHFIRDAALRGAFGLVLRELGNPYGS